jgi:hypothetical protein
MIGAIANGSLKIAGDQSSTAWIALAGFVGETGEKLRRDEVWCPSTLRRPYSPRSSHKLEESGLFHTRRLI